MEDPITAAETTSASGAHSTTGRRRRLAGDARSLCTLAAVMVLSAALASGASALGPGDQAPSFTLPALEGGDQLSLSSYRGKVVWLDFWASWCAPCLTSLPQLEEMRKKLPAEDFQIIAINLDQDPRKARKFLGRNPVGYPSATDPKGRLPKKFGLQTMPTSYLIDRNGVIRLVHEGFRNGDIDTIRSEIKKELRTRK